MLHKKSSLAIFVLVVIFSGLFFMLNGQLSNAGNVNPDSDVTAVVVSAALAEDNVIAPQRLQKLELRLTSGPDAGKVVEAINNRMSPMKARDTDIVLTPGDRVFLKLSSENGVTKYSFLDFDRRYSFYALLALFVAGLLVFGRVIGFKSLLGIFISLIILWQGFINLIIQPGTNVYILSLLFCAGISLVVLIIVSGFSIKTLAAILGTWGGLIFSGILSYLTLYSMHLTGYEVGGEVVFLKSNIFPHLDFRGVLFAGIIIGALGALIDVTISIASAQLEIKQSSSDQLSWRELYQRGMNVGKDVMGAMSMTLVLAYVGSSVPLLLMISALKRLELERIINMPTIMTEIVRALVGSIGLIFAIPLTALIMTALLNMKERGIIRNPVPQLLVKLGRKAGWAKK